MSKFKSSQILVVFSLIMSITIIGLAQSAPTTAPASNPKPAVTPATGQPARQGAKQPIIQPNKASSGSIASANLTTSEVTPEPKSVNWYYERALVYHLREQNGKATIELYKALEKDASDSSVNYLIGVLFKERKLWKEASEAFFKVTQSTKVEHIPARLELAFASVELGNYQIAFLQLEKVIDLAKLDKSFRSRLYQYQVDASTEKDINSAKKKLKVDVKTTLEGFIVELMETLSDSPESYTAATVSLGLNEPLVYNELAQLYDEDKENEEGDDNKTLKALTEFLNKRSGFSPALLAQIGAIYQKQNRNTDAIAAYERVVKQLISLGFSEAAGDFSTEEIQNLTANKTPNKTATPATPSNTTKKTVPIKKPGTTK